MTALLDPRFFVTKQDGPKVLCSSFDAMAIFKTTYSLLLLN